MMARLLAALWFPKTPPFIKGFCTSLGKKSTEEGLAIPSATRQSSPHMSLGEKKLKSEVITPILFQNRLSASELDSMKIFARPAGSEGYSVPTPGPRPCLAYRERAWTPMTN